MVDKNENRLIEKRDFGNIAILVAIALAIGVYLIATTVLISKDGVFYIERAQKFSIDPVAVIKAHPPGYPFLIFIAHKFLTLFGNSSSVQGWIYSAQGITLLCRLLALIPLYLIGKLLVGGKNSFWAILILIFLPFPTRIVCDVVREWPYLLFLTTGFFFLLWGTKYDKWWAFGLVGLSAGLGYLIRHESTQLVVYGFLWIMLSMFRPKLWDVSRWKALVGLTLLIIGFAIPAVPYMKCTGRIIPPKVNHIMKSFSFNVLPDKTDEPKANTVSSNYNTAEIVPQDVLKALGGIFKTTSESLMWFFVPMLLIGFWYYFQRGAKHEERFLITAFITMNVVMMVLRYCYIQLHVSQRWGLPL
ncbi:MAG: ArnT family glycosyltransferase, partial [Planctomycetota bacterium]